MSERPIASSVVSGPRFDGPIADTITLDETQRHRRRVAMTTEGGIEFLLDLPKAQLLMHGDILQLSNGTAIEVLAQPEPLLRVSASSCRRLLSIAWQIGNRHLAAQILEDHILIRRDHVIEEMLLVLDAKVEKVEAPFSPERGAYHSHHHD